MGEIIYFKIKIEMKLFRSIYFIFCVRGAVNPECPSEPARETCELDCTNEYVDCVVECVGDSDCISQCMRQTVACEEVCPCHDDCFDGCPCEPRSEYCLACKYEYRDEYFYCEDQCSFRFINCTDTCKGPTDTECYDRCHNQFVKERKNCPCMENCKAGCPCPNY